MKALPNSERRVPLIFYTGDVPRIDKPKAHAAFGAADDVGDLVDLVVRALSVR